MTGVILGIWCSSSIVNAAAVSSQETEAVSVITGFAEFHIQEHTLEFDADYKPELDFVLGQMPDQLEVYLDGEAEAVSIDVEWFDVEEAYETSDEYYFQFSPSWDETKYVLHEDLDLLTEAPYIAVFLKRAESGIATFAVTSSPYETQIFEYLVGEMGYSVAAACGIMANIQCESGFNPINMENLYESELGFTDETYTMAVDDGTYTNFAIDRVGYGLCQWTSPGRKQGLEEYAWECGTSIGDAGMQLSYLEKELVSGYRRLYRNILTLEDTAENAYVIGYDFCYDYERPANTERNAIKRGNLARDTYWMEYCSEGAAVYAGNLEQLSASAGKITVKGWAYDPEDPAAAMEMRIYVNGKLTASCVADKVRSDIHSAHGCGENHGFELTFDSGLSDTMTATVKVYAVNPYEMTGKYQVTGSPKNVLVVVGNNPFTDVRKSDFFYEPVLWAVSKGITTGTSETMFSPNAVCTRAQAVTFLWRANGCPDPTGNANPFADVKQGEYYYKAVLWAVEKGITTGTSSNTFSPDATVTRSQFVTFLWRTAGKPASGAGNSFTDVMGDAYYANAVLWAVEKGITNGTGDGKFSPDASCTRGQVVTFLYRSASK